MLNIEGRLPNQSERPSLVAATAGVYFAKAWLEQAKLYQWLYDTTRKYFEYAIIINKKLY